MTAARLVGGPADGQMLDVTPTLSSILWVAPAPQPEPTVEVRERVEVSTVVYHRTSVSHGPVRIYATSEVLDRSRAYWVGVRGYLHSLDQTAHEMRGYIDDDAQQVDDFEVPDYKARWPWFCAGCEVGWAAEEPPYCWQCGNPGERRHLKPGPDSMADPFGCFIGE